MQQKKSSNNKKSTNNKPHKQQQVVQTAAQIGTAAQQHKQQNKRQKHFGRSEAGKDWLFNGRRPDSTRRQSSNNSTSRNETAARTTDKEQANTNIWSNVAGVGWVFRTAAPKQRQKQQQRQQQQQEAAATKATRTARKTAHNKKNQHQTAATNGKNCTKSNKRSTNILEGQMRQGCVFHTTTGARSPECGGRRGEEGANPEQLRPRGGPEGWWGKVEEEECLLVEIRWDTGKFCLNQL